MCVTLSSLYLNYRVKHSLLSDSYGVNNRQHACYLVESILKLHSQTVLSDSYGVNNRQHACVLPCRVYTEITVKHSVLSDSYGANNRQHVCYLVESIIKLQSSIVYGMIPMALTIDSMCVTLSSLCLNYTVKHSL